jgi:glutaredoxin-like protein
MTNTLLNDEIISQVREVFTQLDQQVEMLYFGQAEDCPYCDDTRQLLEEVTSVSDKLTLSVYDLGTDHDLAQQYRIDKAPSIALVGKDGDQLIDFGVRYAGIPAGHEFSSLIHSLIQVSRRDSGLSKQTRTALKQIEQPVHLMVFVTPTCPYCPQAVVLAHQLAMENPLIEAEMVEATEFPELSDRFHVSGVPQTTINYGAGTVIGAVPEDHLLSEILKAVNN